MSLSAKRFCVWNTKEGAWKVNQCDCCQPIKVVKSLQGTVKNSEERPSSSFQFPEQDGLDQELFQDFVHSLSLRRPGTLLIPTEKPPVLTWHNSQVSQGHPTLFPSEYPNMVTGPEVKCTGQNFMGPQSPSSADNLPARKTIPPVFYLVPLCPFLSEVLSHT